jgi:alcohol dehydrogenase/propanol-preferring alcohol dehydrogenase
VGQTRLVYPWIGCRNCDQCRAGDENLCSQGQTIGVRRQGGFAELILIPHEEYLIDVDGLDPSWAATLACSGVTSFSAVNKILPCSPEAQIVIIGAGGVGLMATAILVALGHSQICVVDINDDRLQIAQAIGATSIFNTSTASTVGLSLSDVVGGPVAAVIDFVGSAPTTKLGFEALAKNGRLIQVGLFGGSFPVPNALMALKGLTLQGSLVGNRSELEELVSLARDGRLPRIPIVNRAMDVNSINVSLDDLTNGTVDGRIVLVA